MATSGVATRARNGHEAPVPRSRPRVDAIPSDEYAGRREQWADIASVVNLAVRGAFPSSPPFDPRNPAAFQAHWRSVFAWLHGCVVADAGIPTQLASPPVARFEIRLFDGADEALGCPCCLPDTKPSIVLRNEGGVTKGDLVRGLAQYLYGSDEPPLVYKQDPDCDDFRGADQDPSLLRQHRGPALPYEAGWMSTYDGIWIYCSPPEQFAERIRDETETATGGHGQDATERMQAAPRVTERRHVRTRLRL